MAGTIPTSTQHIISQAQNKELLEQRTKQLVNHVEYHSLLTEKYNLLNVLQRYCDQQKTNVFDVMPVTFYVEMADPSNSEVY